MSLIFITHNLNLVHEISDYIIFLKDGEIIEEGETAEIFENPKDKFLQLMDMAKDHRPLCDKDKIESNKIKKLQHIL